MSLLMGQGEEAPSLTEDLTRLEALQSFACLSARVPDAKHSKARENKILKAMEDQLKTENAQLESQLLLA